MVNKKVRLSLVGIDGNAFNIIAAFTKQARKEGWTKEDMDEVINEATKSDYNHLLNTFSSYCTEDDGHIIPDILDEDEDEDDEDEDDFGDDEDDLDDDFDDDEDGSMDDEEDEDDGY